MEVGSNEGMNLYCQHAEAVERLVRAAMERPDAARGLVKCARRHDEKGYEILCSFLSGRRGNGVRSHASGADLLHYEPPSSEGPSSSDRSRR